MLDALLATVPVRGRSGANLRWACGAVRAHAAQMLHDNTIAAPLGQCFDLARQADASLQQMTRVRQIILQETPVSLPAVLVTDASIRFCLATEARIIASMAFASRQDVEQAQSIMNDAFNAAEEVAADAMDSITYIALVSAHAAVTAHLVETARPLPRMLGFLFAMAAPTLIFAHRLYYDSSRANELRVENKVVHPAFMRPRGQALSS